MSATPFRIPMQFDTIEVEFQMPGGELIWWPAFVTSIDRNTGDSSTLACANVTYESGTDRHNNFYEVEHGSVLFKSSSTLRATTKSDTFKQNSTLQWRFAGQSEERINATGDAHDDRTPSGNTSTATHNIDTRSWITRRLDQIEQKQATDVQQFVNLFGTLQRQVTALQQAYATNFNTVVDNERSRQISFVKYFISHRLISLMKRPLSRRSGICDTVFSCALRRHPLEICMPCSLESFSHLALDVSRNVEVKHTLFLPSLAAACAGSRSSKALYIAFENLDKFLTWLNVTDEAEASACQIFKQERVAGTIVRIAGGAQWAKGDPSGPLKLFIGNTCPRVHNPTREGLPSEKVDVLCTDQSVWDVNNAMFAEDFSNGSGWTDFDAMTEDTILDYDSINVKWTPLPLRRTPSPYPTPVLLGDLTVSFPTLVVEGKPFWDSLNISLE